MFCASVRVKWVTVWKVLFLTVFLQISLKSGDELPFVSLGLQTSGIAFLPQFSKLQIKKSEFIYLNLTFSVINPSNTDHLLFMYTITSVMLMWQIWRSKNMWGSAKDTFHHQLVSISLSADVCVPVIFLWETSLQCSYYECALQADFKEV